jgi:hypothetical protein
VWLVSRRGEVGPDPHLFFSLSLSLSLSLCVCVCVCLCCDTMARFFSGGRDQVRRDEEQGR